MIKIGDFSRISRVTVKALRHYDEIGLLKPALVDELTGYRYYTVEQLPRLNRLLALKDLGFTLEQIGALLQSNLTSEQLRGMLLLKQSELQQRVQEEQTRLERVEARLQQIEREGKMSDYEVVVKRLGALKVASIREIIPNYPAIGCLLGQVFEHLGRYGAAPFGPCFAIWHDSEFKESDVDAEACCPVAVSIAATDRIKIYDLPAVETAASVIHHGSYARLNEAYTALSNWIGANGYTITGGGREIYLQSKGDGNQHDESCVTEIQFPVARA